MLDLAYLLAKCLAFTDEPHLCGGGKLFANTFWGSPARALWIGLIKGRLTREKHTHLFHISFMPDGSIYKEMKIPFKPEWFYKFWWRVESHGKMWWDKTVGTKVVTGGSVSRPVHSDSSRYPSEGRESFLHLLLLKSFQLKVFLMSKWHIWGQHILAYPDPPHYLQDSNLALAKPCVNTRHGL